MPDLTRRSFMGLSGAVAAGLVGCTASPSRDDQAAEPPEDNSADLLITNAVVQTMVAEDETAEAVAIKGNRIVFVGSAADAEQQAGNRTRRIDLQGGFVAPGFMDGHLHAPGAAVDELYNCILTNYTTNEEYLEALGAHVTANPERTAYFGIDFAPSIYRRDDGSDPGPDRADLDALCPDKPMVVYGAAHDRIWVNSKALELGGVTKETADPEGGYLYREEDGTPHGCLVGTAVSLIPVEQSYTEDEYLEALRLFCATCNAVGLTGITDIDALGEEGMRLLHQLEEAGELTLRMNVVPTCAAGDDPRQTLDLVSRNQQYASELLSCKTVKVFADGVTERGTAWMSEPYAEAAGKGAAWCGEPLWSDDDLRELVARCGKADVQVHAHAFGDAAVRQVVDAFVAADRPALRPTITHVCRIADDDIQRMADHDILAALQFLWMYYDGLCDLEMAYLGEERALSCYPVCTMWDAGIRICGSSDGPATSLSPLEGMEVGITRNSPYPGEQDEDFYRWPAQGLRAYELLQAYTTHVAYENFWEDLVGTIEVGKRADLVCLDTNILTCDPKQISEACVYYTIVDGRVVYER